MMVASFLLYDSDSDSDGSESTNDIGPNLAEDEEEEEEPPAQRPRRLPENSPSFLESLNADCLLLVLSFLHYEDLNSVAICSSRYRQARAHESLDQTRSGAITVSANWTLSDFQNEAMQRGWDRIFQGNRTKLIIKGIGENWIPTLTSATPRAPRGAVIPGVASLVISDPTPARALLPFLNSHLLQLFPNVVQVKFLHTTRAWRAPRFAVRCGRRLQNLSKLSWIGCRPKMRFNGRELQYASAHFQLYIDSCRFLLEKGESAYMYSDHTSHESVYLFHLCPRLERLSIKNAMTISDGGRALLSQDIIIKMVRRHPGLRWLRSDLSDENVAMLQEERPDITFVTD